METKEKRPERSHEISGFVEFFNKLNGAKELQGIPLK